MRKEHLDQMEEEGNAIHDADVPMLAKSEQEYQNQITEQSAMLERETSKLLADCIRMSQVRSISSQQFAAWKDQQADEIRKLNESVQKSQLCTQQRLFCWRSAIDTILITVHFVCCR